MSRKIQTLDSDVVVIGGGIAGLWLFNALNKQGYKALLLENSTLGGGQTIKSQGIVHGGTKYTLSGNLTKAAECIAGMPDRWRRALAGDDDVDLRDVKILSEGHYLWSPGDIASRMTSFFASKALRGRVDQLKKEEDFPDIFRHKGFRGKVYQLNEIVLDIQTVIKALTKNFQSRILKVDWQQDTTVVTSNGEIDCIEHKLGDETLQIKAKKFIMTAGEGTVGLMKQMNISKPEMQLRPLHMVMLKTSHQEPLYAHCLGTKIVPRMTITSHPTEDGNWVWYLGGEIAEDGMERNPEEQIRVAKRELSVLLPWVNLDDADWATLFVNRAEPKQSKLLRPDAAFIHHSGNTMVTWPTKLALAPNLTDEVGKQLNIEPSGNEGFALPEGVTHPEICQPFWSEAFNKNA
ncbi:FAD-dependent oxidoreductase [Endozoicomonas sp. OPT23]|uniref:FAD-dependent oxidoreductase n=1 Tax=Endozoicomonas sp. OPT23 TaxID=2072845 RepID=UPI00129ACF63|nr:FAD-dependent oxidoreductase [Endozoicomonas sp. OPT23]MRI31952.1 FAD-dependent oxidoreductase [Endozoicomonas sp. OPT23]